MRGFQVAKGFEDKEVKIPQRQTGKSAGYDLSVVNGATIYPGTFSIFNTGLKAYMQDDEFLSMHVRSSLGIKKNLMLANTTGIIDSDFYENPENDGHIRIALYNMSDAPVEIADGERVVQCIFSKYLTVDKDTPKTEERKGGIGSTGHE